MLVLLRDWNSEYVVFIYGTGVYSFVYNTSYWGLATPAVVVVCCKGEILYSSVLCGFT